MMETTAIKDFLRKAEAYAQNLHSKPDATQATADLIAAVQAIWEKVDEIDKTLSRNKIV